MNSWKAWLAISLIFVLGFLSGAASYHVARTRMERQLFESKDVVIQILLHRMTKDLDLTPDQQARVKTALLDGRRDLVVLQKDLFPVVEQVFEKTSGRISTVLTPHQRQKFEAVVARRRQMLDEAVRRSQEVPEPLQK